jgi:hypothetical protein
VMESHAELQQEQEQGRRRREEGRRGEGGESMHSRK